MHKIEIKIIRGCLRIYINKTLHLSIQTGGFLGVQSYIKDKVYYISYYVDGHEIETDYIDIKIWKQILKQLEKQKFI